MAADNQRPIGSGFGAKTPAADVVQGMDLSGQNFIVTGGYSGIGIEAVRALAGVGASVTVPARRPDAAKEALQRSKAMSTSQAWISRTLAPFVSSQMIMSGQAAR